MIKGFLSVLGMVFIAVVFFFLDSFYGKFGSFQFCLLLISLSIMVVLLLIDIFTSKIENYIKSLRKIDIIGIYFSATITILIGTIGIIGVVISILNGNFYVEYSESQIELIKLRWQSMVWFVFLGYFTSVVSFLFILPLKERLDVLNKSR